MLTSQKILLVKEETTYGVDSLPTPDSNAIEARDIKINYVGEVLERNLVKSSLSQDIARLGQRNIEIQFVCEIKGSGTAGVAPAIGDLLEACGFAETINLDGLGNPISVEYKPASTGLKSATIYLYEIEDGNNVVLHKVLGAVGNVSFKFEAGQIPVAEFTFKGLYSAPVDTTVPSGVAYESSLPVVVESLQFTLNGNSDLVVQSVTIDMANEVSKRDDLNSPAGIKGFRIVGRKPNGSFNPEAVLVATYDFYADWVNATGRALSLVVGSQAGNKVTVSAPNVTIDAISEGDREGIRVNDIPFRLAMSSGDDEIDLLFE